MRKLTDILNELTARPVLKRKLLKDRSASYRMAYDSLLAEGSIREFGSGRRYDPVYVGLPGSAPVVKPKPVRFRRADIAVLVKAGWTADDAIFYLKGVTVGQTDNSKLIGLLRAAKLKIEQDKRENEAKAAENATSKVSAAAI